MAGQKRRTKALRFSYVELQNWKNFLHVALPLPLRAFVVGPNASGKSNFLDVFRFLRDLVSEGGGLQTAVHRRGGLKAIRCLAARRQPLVEIRVRVSSATTEDPQAFVWEYSLSLDQERRGSVVVRKERVVQRDASGHTHTLLERPTRADQTDPERLTQTHLEQITTNKPFRELVEFFRSIRYLHIVPQLVREPDRSIGRINDPYGGDFLERIAKTPASTRKRRLERIREALRIAVPQLESIELWRDTRGTPHLRTKYKHWRPHGAWQTEEQLSDGTLRLLGLLWAVLDGQGPLLLEEPELSLHPAVVRHIPQMLARVQRRTYRQTLVSTHSPDLLQDEGIGGDETIVLVPDKEATKAHTVVELDKAGKLLDAGVPAGEIALAQTRPENVQQLSLFAER